MDKTVTLSESSSLLSNEEGKLSDVSMACSIISFLENVDYCCWAYSYAKAMFTLRSFFDSLLRRLSSVSTVAMVAAEAGIMILPSAADYNSKDGSAPPACRICNCCSCFFLLREGSVDLRLFFIKL